MHYIIKNKMRREITRHFKYRWTLTRVRKPPASSRSPK